MGCPRSGRNNAGETLSGSSYIRPAKGPDKLAPMKSVRIIAGLTAISLPLAACGTGGGDGPGGPGEPPPGECREVVTHVSTSRTLTSQGDGCDYLFAGGILYISATLTVEPGTLVAVAEDTVIRIIDGGRVIAEGTADDPIYFAGAEPTPGYWNGFCFERHHHGAVFDHVVLAWGGQVHAGGYCRGLIGSYRSQSNEPVSVTNSIVIGSNTTGIDATGFVLGDFGNNVLAGNEEYGLRIAADGIRRLDATTNYSGAGYTMPDGSDGTNGQPHVFVEAVTRGDGEEHFWRNLGTPYIFHDDPHYGHSLWIDEGTTVIVEAGTTVLMGPGTRITVEGNSRLELRGEPGAPVTISGIPEESGVWDGIRLFGGGIVAEHAEIAFGGSDDGPVNANLGFSYLGDISVCSHLRDVTVRGSANWGIQIDPTYSDHVRLDRISYPDNAGGEVDGEALGPAILDSEDCNQG